MISLLDRYDHVGRVRRPERRVHPDQRGITRSDQYGFVPANLLDAQRPLVGEFVVANNEDSRSPLGGAHCPKTRSR